MVQHNNTICIKRSPFGEYVMLETDVLICGYGIGGLMSAYYCNQHNIDHVVLEKNAFPGGLSNLSGGGFATSNNINSTIQYLIKTNNNLRSFEHTKTIAEGMFHLRNEIKNIAKNVGASVNEVQDVKYKYDFEGSDSIGCSELYGLDSKHLNPQVSFGNTDASENKGWQAVHFLSSYNEKHRTKVLYNNHATHIDNVNKIVTTIKEKIKYKKLIIATGGYESSKSMQLENSESGNESDVLNYGVWFNTGDGIKMLNQLGAMNYHMWHMHGSYAFKHPEDQSIGLRINSRCNHIVVKESGERLSGNHTYPSDTRYRPLLNNSNADTSTKAFFISDETARKSGPFASVKFMSRKKLNYTKWSDNSILEIKQGIIVPAKNYDILANIIGCDVDTIKKSIGDKLEAPFLVGEVFPMIANTQGGPKRNEHGQVLDSYESPIPDIYSVGEIGSWWSHLYLTSGNWAEALIGSKAVVQHISRRLQKA